MISPLALCSSISLPAGTTRRITSTCSARTSVFVWAEASADPKGRTSTISPGFACGIAIRFLLIIQAPTDDHFGYSRHLIEFYDAFGVKEADKLWLPSKDRVRIW